MANRSQVSRMLLAVLTVSGRRRPCWTMQITSSVAFLIALFTPAVFAATLQVGPTRTYTTMSAAAAACQDGDTIEVDAGTYAGSAATAVYTANNLTIRGVGGRPLLDAQLTAAAQKGTIVQYGNNLTVDNLELANAWLSSTDGGNGAGIRAQGNNLTVQNCYIHDNQDGILNGQGVVLVQNCELFRNGAGDGQTHNIYINSTCTSFTFQYNYSHGAIVGHELKSRAAVNYILYNRIMDENSNASYTVDIPQGGTTYLIGNLIQQGVNTGNSNIIVYKEEAPTNPDLHLFVVNNTVVNDRGSGTFIWNNSGVPAVVANNIFMGGGTVMNGVDTETNNLVTSDSTLLVDRAGFDYHLTATASAAIDKGANPGTGMGFSLTPVYQYVHPCNSQARPVMGTLDVGAYEYVSSNQAPTVATSASATPNPTAGTTTDLSVLGADDGGESALVYTWSASGPAAVTYSANNTHAAKNSTATFAQAGNYNFTATIKDASGLTVTSSVNVIVNQTLKTLGVSPSTTAVVAGGSVTFLGSGKDQFGNTMSPQPTFTWTVSGGGTISSAGLFTAGSTAGGPFTVTAASGGKSGTASVTVTPTTTVGTITVTPSSANVVAQGTQTYSATAKDQFGNTMTPQPTITWTVSGGGTISSAGLFTAGTAASGPFTVTAASGGKSGTASVTVTATTTLGSITVTPSSANVVAQGTQSYSASAKDQFGNTMSPQPTITWTVSGGGTISSAGLFTAGTTAGGPFTVTAASGGKSGTASVTVTATTTLGSIVVTPSTATVLFTATKQFTASAKDQFGNTLAAQPTFTWTVSGGGTINATGLFTAGSVAGGPFTVTASSGGKNGTASVTVALAQTLTAIVVTPTPVTVITSTTKQFTAVANDQFGNAMAAQPTFTWTATGGTVSAAGLYSAGATAGSFSVTAASGGINGSAVVTLQNPPVLTAIVVTPSSLTLAPGATQQFTAVANDQYGAALVPQPAFTWSATSGTISATGLFTTPTQGGAVVTASVGGKGGTASVLVARSPSIGSPPTVPGTVSVGVPITISTGATDPSGGTLTYTWNFGDGGTGSGSTVTYTYATPGTYTLTLTVTSSTGVSTTMTIPVVVAANGGGGGAQALVPMTLSKMLGSMSFTSKGKDSTSFSGVIPGLPVGFVPTGVPLTLKVGSATVQFTLDAKGRAKNAQGSIQLTLKQSKRSKTVKTTSFIGGNAPVKGKLQHGTWAAAWGFNPLAAAPATLALEIDVNGVSYGATVTIAAKMTPKSAKFKH